MDDWMSTVTTPHAGQGQGSHDPHLSVGSSAGTGFFSRRSSSQQQPAGGIPCPALHPGGMVCYRAGWGRRTHKLHQTGASNNSTGFCTEQSGFPKHQRMCPSSVHLTMSVAMQRCIMSSCSSLSRNSPADDLHTNSKQWYLLRGCWLVQGANRAPAGRSAARRRERPPPSGCPPSRAASQGSRTGPAKAWPAAARWPEKQSKVTFLAAPERHPESSTP